MSDKKRYQPYVNEKEDHLIKQATALAFEFRHPAELMRYGGLLLAKAIVEASRERGGAAVSVHDQVVKEGSML